MSIGLALLWLVTIIVVIMAVHDMAKDDWRMLLVALMLMLVTGTCTYVRFVA